MKRCVFTVSFNISEKDYSSKEFTDFKNNILNGELQRELKDNKLGMVDLTCNLTTK